MLIHDDFFGGSAETSSGRVAMGSVSAESVYAIGSSLLSSEMMRGLLEVLDRCIFGDRGGIVVIACSVCSIARSMRVAPLGS
jgi:hypothetical protein